MNYQPTAISQPITLPISQKVLVLLGLTATMFLVPALIHNQIITGPLVNAVLLIIAMVVSPSVAITVGLFPSLVALVSGTLPAPLTPMIPFIMVSNALYIAIFSSLKKYPAIGVLVGSCAKYLFLSQVALIFLPQFIPVKLMPNVIAMMQLPQLLTALAGGIIALSVVKGFSVISTSKSS